MRADYLVSSNVVRTPRFGMSDVVDEEWMMPEDLYWKVFTLSGGFGRGTSSYGGGQLVEKYLKEIASSEQAASRKRSGRRSRRTRLPHNPLTEPLLTLA